MKILFDFFPIILFFASFKFAEGRPDASAHLATDWFGFMVNGGVVGPKEGPIVMATVVVIAATLAQIAYLKLRGRRIDMMLWVSLALVTVFGGATIWFHDETFIKWKPTILYWVMGLAFLLAPVVAGRNLLRTLLGEQVELPDPVWARLNVAWVLFFAVMGVLNLWVAFNFPLDTWVNFKLFGGIGLTLVFTLVQGLYMSRYIEQDEPNKP